MNLRFDWINDLNGIHALGSDWQALEDRCARAEHLFQTWLWNLTWWKHFGSGSQYQLRVLTGRVDQKLMLVWPLVETRQGPVRILEGTGGVLTCFHDALVDNSPVGEQCLDAAWTWLQANAGVGAISMPAVHEAANVSRIFERESVEPVQVESAAIINLKSLSSYAEFAQSQSKMFRKELLRARTNLDKLGKVTVLESDKSILPRAAVAAVIAFKRDWVRDHGLAPSTILSKQGESFLSEYCALLHCGADESVELRVGTIQLDEAVIACGLAFSFRDHQLEYLGGFDSNHRRIGVGKLQLAASVAYAIESDSRVCNLLTPMTKFKMRWTEDRAVVKQYYYARSLNGKIYRHVYLGRVRPVVKRLYNWVLPRMRRTKAFGRVQT